MFLNTFSDTFNTDVIQQHMRVLKPNVWDTSSFTRPQLTF